MATGEIINWINSDDIVAENALMKIGHFFKSNVDVDVLIGRSHLIDQDGFIMKKRESMKFSSKALWSLSASMTQPAVFFRKSILDKTGLLDEELNWVMDQDLYFRIDINGFKFRSRPYLLNYFRIHDDAKSVSSRTELIKQLDFLLNKKYNNPIPVKFRSLLWYYYRSKRHLVNLPVKLPYALRLLFLGKVHYKNK